MLVYLLNGVATSPENCSMLRSLEHIRFAAPHIRSMLKIRLQKFLVCKICILIQVYAAFFMHAIRTVFKISSLSQAYNRHKSKEL